MGAVAQFPRRFRVLCSDVSLEQLDEAQTRLSDMLTNSLIACPACAGRGLFPHKHPVTGFLSFTSCPCGGTDEDRIETPYFDGIA